MYQVAIYMYKLNHKLIPITNFAFVLNADIHCHNTHQSSLFHTDYCRTKTCRATIRYQGPKIWNIIPDKIKLLSIGTFKSHLKVYLLDLI